MKLFILIFAFLNIFGNSPIPEGVEFGHKRINKEISKTLETESFDISELERLANISKNGTELGKYYNLKVEGSNAGFAYIGRVFTCPMGGCDGNEDISGTPEYFDYLILFDKNIELTKISIFNYSATHGQEVCAKGWLKQFIGYNGSEELKFGKNIDAISGATKSSIAIVADVRDRTLDLHKALNIAKDL